MYFARVNTDLSYPKIGEAFGGRDHSTVIYAYEKILKVSRTIADLQEKDKITTEDISQAVSYKTMEGVR